MAVPIKRFQVEGDPDDPKVPKEIGVADCCALYDTKCPFRGGDEECSGMLCYDPEMMEGGEDNMLIICTCGCHKKPAAA